MVSNELIRDNSLSPRTRWLLIYLLSNQDGWKISVKQIIEHLKGIKSHGRDSVYSMMNEAMEAGYMHREQKKVHGKYIESTYYISERPKFKKSLPLTGLSDAQTADSANTEDNNNHISSLRSDMKKDYLKECPKSEEPTSVPNSKKFQDEDLEIAKHLLEKKKNLFPETKDPNIESWAKEIRLIREVDKRSTKSLREAIDWAYENDFWCAVILSPTTLRKNFDKMSAQMAPISNRGAIVQKNKELARKVINFLISKRGKSTIQVYKDNIHDSLSNQDVYYDLPHETFKEIILKWANIEEEDK